MSCGLIGTGTSRPHSLFADWCLSLLGRNEKTGILIFVIVIIVI